MNKDQVKGRINEAKGAVKETVGKATGNPGTQLKGNLQKNAGKVQAAVGDAREDAKQSVRGSTKH